jgi:hypothetical protein
MSPGAKYTTTHIYRIRNMLWLRPIHQRHRQRPPRHSWPRHPSHRRLHQRQHQNHLRLRLRQHMGRNTILHTLRQRLPSMRWLRPTHQRHRQPTPRRRWTHRPSHRRLRQQRHQNHLRLRLRQHMGRNTQQRTRRQRLPSMRQNRL